MEPTTMPPATSADLAAPPDTIPNLDDLPSEDGKPVDNIYVERQYKLLVEPLYSSWTGPGKGRPWVALANVGWYHTVHQPPLVPDFLLSLNLTLRDPHSKEGRSYIQWVVGKQPDLVLEIVSDRSGGEATFKFDEYARLDVAYYVIFDPKRYLKKEVLRAFQRNGKQYKPTDAKWIADVGLGLTFWKGEYMGLDETWLRWCDRDGRVIPTGQEGAALANVAAAKAKKERRKSEAARKLVAEENDKLREKLRAAGIDPNA